MSSISFNGLLNFVRIKVYQCFLILKTCTLCCIFYISLHKTKHAENKQYQLRYTHYVESYIYLLMLQVFPNHDDLRHCVSWISYRYPGLPWTSPAVTSSR